MLFNKPLLSFVMAFAAASSVVASTIPLARDGYIPSPPTNECNNGSPYCCNTVTNSQDPAVLGIGDLVSTLKDNLVNGLDCNSVLGVTGGTW
jgi:hypothetical protein